MEWVVQGMNMIRKEGRKGKKGRSGEMDKRAIGENKEW